MQTPLIRQPRKHEVFIMVTVPIQRSTTVALSLQQALWPQLEATASNLANGSTGGFKRVLVDTKEVKQTSTDGQIVSYTYASNITRDFSDGAVKQTENPLDVAISGPGFFQVSGGQLTRNGQFSINQSGQLITTDGQTVLGDGGEVNIPSSAKYIKIASDGTISTDQGKIGKIGIFTVEDEKSLNYGANGYYTGGGNITALNKPKVLQGFVEESNVQPITETIKLMDILRTFEYAQKIIEDQAKQQSQVINASSRNAI